MTPDRRAIRTLLIGIGAAVIAYIIDLGLSLFGYGLSELLGGN